MDVVIYLVAVATLIVLIIFAVKVRGRTAEGETKNLAKEILTKLNAN